MIAVLNEPEFPGFDIREEYPSVLGHGALATCSIAVENTWIEQFRFEISAPIDSHMFPGERFLHEPLRSDRMFIEDGRVFKGPTLVGRPYVNRRWPRIVVNMIEIPEVEFMRIAGSPLAEVGGDRRARFESRNFVAAETSLELNDPFTEIHFLFFERHSRHLSASGLLGNGVFLHIYEQRIDHVLIGREFRRLVSRMLLRKQILRQIDRLLLGEPQLRHARVVGIMSRIAKPVVQPCPRLIRCPPFGEFRPDGGEFRTEPSVSLRLKGHQVPLQTRVLIGSNLRRGFPATVQFKETDVGIRCFALGIFLNPPRVLTDTG